MASSMLQNDFNGKKSKIIQTLRQLDELKSGVVKQSIFENIIGCLDVQLEQEELDECQKKLGLCYQGQPYIKYEAVVRLMHFDNHAEKWAIRRSKDDEGETLSVITEKQVRGGRHLRHVGLRQSFDVNRKKPSLQRESLRNAMRASTTVLSQTALATLDETNKQKEDEEAVELLSQRKSNRAVSLRKPAADQRSVAKS